MATPDPQSSTASPDSAALAAAPDFDRYSRQTLFRGIGPAGQQALGRSRVAVVGVGATGAAAASLLARAGVGHLTLLDRDFVEPSNLQRQILFDEADAAASLPKAEAARRKLLSFNSSITVEAHITDLVPANIQELLSRVDLILDATDNFETRYLLNDFAVANGIPWIYAAAVGAYAATMSILPRRVPPSADTSVVAPTNASHFRATAPPPIQPAWQPTACLACLFPEPPSGPVDTCDTAGILSTAVNLAASLQVTEALKFLTGRFSELRRTLVSFDLWQPAANGRMEQSQIAAGSPRPGCEVCDLRHFRHLAGTARPHITLCGRDSVQIHEHHRPLDLAGLRERLEHIPDLANIRSNSMLLRFRRGPHTLTLFADGRALIHGTTDPAIARSLYARYIGS